MGASGSKADQEAANSLVIGRLPGVGEGTRKSKGTSTLLPPSCTRSSSDDWPRIEECLSKTLLFAKLEPALQRKVVTDMYEKKVSAGEIVIQEGETGRAASEMYVVKSGAFEVLERRAGVSLRVNEKHSGDCFGEISLLYSTPRSATVAATEDSIVWVLQRENYRQHVKEGQESKQSNNEVFLNSVPLLTSLSKEERSRLVAALEEESYVPGSEVIKEGEPGESFYIIKEGEAHVTQRKSDGKIEQVNILFKADFFGERALLSREARNSTVTAVTPLVCLTLKRETFVDILGPLEEIMQREKSPTVVEQRLSKLRTHGQASSVRAAVHVRRKTKGTPGNSERKWEVVKAVGHLDEVVQMRAKGVESSTVSERGEQMELLTLTESTVLGGGAFSRVSIVTEETTGRQYAMKRMRKTAVMACPEHVSCEQTITRNIAHPFCIRQYASFQDRYNLFFLFDLMDGGDLMDVLVAEAKVIKRRIPQGLLRQACFAPKTKMLKGMDEKLARFYIASLILALEYLHQNSIIYRDLKPENVFIDHAGFIKLGDFGFAKIVEDGKRTYTFCGTPGYVAPENVLARGYNVSVDWWGLGVLLYVLLTGRQPFSSPKTDDAMVVMRRIVDETFIIKYPPYLSNHAKDLLQRLLERKPARRLGMLQGRANDVKKHPWFSGVDWEALNSRRVSSPRLPQQDADKRLKELQEQERRTRREPKDTDEELREANVIFADF